MNIEKIVAIAGKPGLYQIISQSKNGVIVESLQDNKRFSVNAIHSISSLSDIAIYTYEEEVPLKEVFLNINKKENGTEAINHKSDKQELLDYFREVLPNYDEERVYASNLKKIAQWYNILIASKFDFSSIKEKEEDVKESDSKK